MIISCPHRIAEMVGALVRSIGDSLRAELIANPVTLILAMLAILFAIIQFADSLHLKGKMRRVLRNEDQLLGRVDALTLKTEKELTQLESLIGRMNTVASSIEAVERSLSSRFVGTFPKNLREINEVIPRAD